MGVFVYMIHVVFSLALYVHIGVIAEASHSGGVLTPTYITGNTVFKLSVDIYSYLLISNNCTCCLLINEF